MFARSRVELFALLLARHIRIPAIVSDRIICCSLMSVNGSWYDVRNITIASVGHL